MANVIVGQFLADGVVKGGSALRVRFGFAATRFSRDFDAARAKDIESFISIFEANLSKGWNGFSGRIVPKSSARPKEVPARYVMQPFEIKLDYNGKSWITVPLEIGHDEIGDADEPEFYISQDIVELFVSLGFPEPNPLPLTSLDYQVAQKLHGVSEPESKRAHDLIDLQIIMKYGVLDFARTKTICCRLFTYRNQHSWPPTIVCGNNWESLYAEQSKELDVLPTVDEAIVWANDLIRQIDGETVQ